MVQWALAYGAFALVVLELTDFLGDAFDWPVVVARVMTVVVAFAFLAVLVIAWYHGEEGHQRVRASELALLTVIALLGGSVAWWVGVRAAEEAEAQIVADASADSPIRPAAAVADGRTGLAVLPFVNIGGDADSEYFSDGMTEDIIAELSRADGLRVISRTSVMQYKGSDKNIPQIGRELGVDVILEGSVRRSDDQIRIVAQLIDAETDEHLWSETYDRDARDILALQTDVARSIAAALSGRLGPQVQLADAGDRPEIDPEAYNLYLQGRQLSTSVAPNDRERATELLNAALARDSNVAVAFTGMAEALVPLEADAQEMVPPSPPALDRVIERAMEKLPESAPFRTTVVMRRALDEGDFTRAEEAARRAVEQNPNQPQAQRWYGLLLGRMERYDEALEHLRAAQALDPHSPLIATELGEMLYAAGRIDEAVVQLESVLSKHPRHTPARMNLGLALHARGDEERAVAELRAAAEQSNNPAVLGSLGFVLATAGHATEARVVLDSLKLVRSHITPAAVAHIYAGLGEAQEALRWIETAAVSQAGALLSPRLTRDLHALRDDPRFAAMLRGRTGPVQPDSARRRREPAPPAGPK
jgi:adenylate cyclase